MNTLKRFVACLDAWRDDAIVSRLSRVAGLELCDLGLSRFVASKSLPPLSCECGRLCEQSNMKYSGVFFVPIPLKKRTCTTSLTLKVLCSSYCSHIENTAQAT